MLSRSLQLSFSKSKRKNINRAVIIKERMVSYKELQKEDSGQVSQTWASVFSSVNREFTTYFPQLGKEVTHHGAHVWHMADA